MLIEIRLRVSSPMSCRCYYYADYAAIFASFDAFHLRLRRCLERDGYAFFHAACHAATFTLLSRFRRHATDYVHFSMLS